MERSASDGGRESAGGARAQRVHFLLLLHGRVHGETYVCRGLRPGYTRDAQHPGEGKQQNFRNVCILIKNDTKKFTLYIK